MSNSKVTYIPNELASAVKGGFVTSSKEIRDKNLNSSQEDINRRVVQAGDDIYHLQQTKFSGSYLDLTDKPTIPAIPGNISYFENDLDYASKEYVRNLLAEVLSNYPETLEAVRNLSEALTDNVRELLDALSIKANTADVYSKTESDLRFLREHQDISGKANVDDVYSKDKTYSKSEVNVKIGDLGDLSVKQYIAQLLTILHNNISSEIIEVLAREINISDFYTKTQSDLIFQKKGNYATEEFVDQQIGNIQFPDYYNLEEYVQQIQQQMNLLEQVQQQINLLQQKQLQLQEYITQLQNSEQKHIILSQSQYDNLGTYEKDVIYLILEDEESIINNTNWRFGDGLPIILSENWQFGDNLPIILSRELQESQQQTNTYNNGYEYVDLGLPSGTKWAKCNIGASEEINYGNYYMYGKGASQYNSSDSPYTGTEDPLDTQYDTATQVMGAPWHMPTKEQFEELMENTIFSWETNFNNSGKNGAKFTSENGKYIFIPAAGFMDEGTLTSVGSNAFVYTSTPYSENGEYAAEMNITGQYFVDYFYGRIEGYSVRGVID